MNNQIEMWRVQQYAANVYQLSQQRGSKLARLVRNEEFIGKTEYFDRLGLATAIDKTTRNSDTPNLDIEHSRRALSTLTREWGTLVDRKDKVQQIHNPENEYSIAAQNALGRKMDEVLIAAAFGNARYGESGESNQALGNDQKITSVAAGVLDYANIQLLRKASAKFNASEVEGRRYLVHDSAFLESLLSHSETTSHDYNTVKALVRGELDTFMGFTFIHSERIASVLSATYDTGDYHFNTTTGLYDAGGTDLIGTEKTALCFVEDGLIFGKNPNAIARVSEREDKSYSTQVYASMDFGGVRMEEAKVIQLIFKA